MTINANILLAENDLTAAHNLLKLLLHRGYTAVRAVHTAEEVIEDVTDNLPDIILMSINLGCKIDEICAAQKVHVLFDTPVIYITAHSDSEKFERSMATEPYAYITRPYEIFQVQNAIEIALFKHGLKNQLKNSENKYRTIFEVSDNAMMLVNEHSTITMVNEQFETLTGFSKESVENLKCWTDFFDDNEWPKLEKRLHHTVNTPSATRPHFESILVDNKGNTKCIYTNVKRIPDSNTVIVSMNDISELKLAEMEIKQLNKELNATNEGLKHEVTLRESVEKQLRYKATHDHLTGLPNRVLLFDRLKQAFAFEARHNTLIALMILDLDNFKNVNDTMGHLSGDILLKKIAEELQKCTRQYDTVGRMGGDEFVLIINDAETIHGIITFAEKVQAVFQKPFDILGQQTRVTTSIGVAVCPLHGSTIEELLKKADMAMYLAKKEGRNTFRFYSDSMDIIDSHRQNAMRTKRRLDQMQEYALDHLLSEADGGSKKSALVH